MKVEFWLTLVPKYGRGDEITKVVADKITKTRPTRGHGVAVKVSLDVSESLFHPLRVEGEFGSETETVVLKPERAFDSLRDGFAVVMPVFCQDCRDYNEEGTGVNCCEADSRQFGKCISAHANDGVEYGPVE